MLFRHLSKRSAGSLLTTVEVYVVSLAAHAALISAAVASGASQPALQELPESMEWAKFLLPRDRPQGNAAVKREHVTYFNASAAPGGSGTAATDTKEPERVPFTVPVGEKAEELVGTAVVPDPQPEIKGDEVMTVLDVDTAAVRVDDSAAPPYPPAMLARKIEGSVAIQYIVDTTGRADTTSVVILETTHPDFARSVRETLPHMRFRSAKINEQKVRQLVQQMFSFRIDTAALRAPKKP